MKWLAAIVIAVSLGLAATPGLVFAVAVDEDILTDPKAEAAAREIMKGIRCLVCQNQSIEDSNADLAKDLRRLVRERVAAGDGEEEVHAFLIARYGDWVLLKPPLNSRTLLLWLGPFLFLILGGAGLILAARRGRAESASGTEGLSEEDQEILDKLLAEDEQ